MAAASGVARPQRRTSANTRTARGATAAISAAAMPSAPRTPRSPRQPRATRQHRPTLVALPPRYLEAVSAEEQAGLALAQASWMTRQATLDARIPRYGRQVNADEMEQALRILRGLFDLATPHLTLRAAMSWGVTLLEMAEEAALDDRAPLFALPYVYLSKAELDACERADGLAGETALKPRTVRRGRKSSVNGNTGTNRSASAKGQQTTALPRRRRVREER